MQSVIDILRGYIDSAIDTFYYEGYAERLYSFCIRHRIKQRLLGFVFIFLGIIVGWIEVEPGVHDLTFSLVLIPIGLVLIFTSHDLFESQ